MQCFTVFNLFVITFTVLLVCIVLYVAEKGNYFSTSSLGQETVDLLDCKCITSLWWNTFVFTAYLGIAVVFLLLLLLLLWEAPFGFFSFAIYWALSQKLSEREWGMKWKTRIARRERVVLPACLLCEHTISLYWEIYVPEQCLL